MLDALDNFGIPREHFYELAQDRTAWRMLLHGEWGDQRGEDVEERRGERDLVELTERARSGDGADRQRTVVWTDGSTLNNGKRDARSGSGAFWATKDERNISAPLPGPVQTNNRSELYAVILVLEAVLPTELLEIRSDSAYVVKMFHTRLPIWRLNGYRDARGQSVPHAAFWKRLDELCRGREGPILMTKVWGHTADKIRRGKVRAQEVKEEDRVGNDGADALAGAAAEQNKKPAPLPRWARDDGERGRSQRSMGVRRDGR